jgi:hypothetical protein
MTGRGPFDLCGDDGLDSPAADVVHRLALEGFWALWDRHLPPVTDMVGAGPAVNGAIGHLPARGRIEVSASLCSDTVVELTLSNTLDTLCVAF